MTLENNAVLTAKDAKKFYHDKVTEPLKNEVDDIIDNKTAEKIKKDGGGWGLGAKAEGKAGKILLNGKINGIENIVSKEIDEIVKKYGHITGAQLKDLITDVQSHIHGRDTDNKYGLNDIMHKTKKGEPENSTNYMISQDDLDKMSGMVKNSYASNTKETSKDFGHIDLKGHEGLADILKHHKGFSGAEIGNFSPPTANAAITNSVQKGGIV